MFTIEETYFSSKFQARVFLHSEPSTCYPLVRNMVVVLATWVAALGVVVVVVVAVVVVATVAAAVVVVALSDSVSDISTTKEGSIHNWMTILVYIGLLHDKYTFQRHGSEVFQRYGPHVSRKPCDAYVLITAERSIPQFRTRPK